MPNDRTLRRIEREMEERWIGRVVRFPLKGLEEGDWYLRRGPWAAIIVVFGDSC